MDLAKAQDGLVCIWITKSQQGSQINDAPYTPQITVSFSTTMRKQHNKGYKGGCQWNWHFSTAAYLVNRFTVNSTARLELKAKQNCFFSYNTQESLYSGIQSCWWFNEVQSQRGGFIQRRKGTWLPPPLHSPSPGSSPSTGSLLSWTSSSTSAAFRPSLPG